MDERWFAEVQVYFSNYQFLFSDPLYVDAYLNSMKIALDIDHHCAFDRLPNCLLHRAQPPTSRRNILLMLIILPFWTSFLLRVYAWIGILKSNGLVNNFLLWTGLITEPLVMLQTDFAVYIGIVYSYLPFMILPLYANLDKLDDTLLEAASDLGCQTHRDILHGHTAAVISRHHRRLDAGFHSGGWRVRYSVTARWARHADDRLASCGMSFSPTATGRWRPLWP